MSLHCFPLGLPQGKLVEGKNSQFLRLRKNGKLWLWKARSCDYRNPDIEAQESLVDAKKSQVLWIRRARRFGYQKNQLQNKLTV
jgi:hypothetical protein